MERSSLVRTYPSARSERVFQNGGLGAQEPTGSNDNGANSPPTTKSMVTTDLVVSGLALGALFLISRTGR